MKKQFFLGYFAAAILAISSIAHAAIFENMDNATSWVTQTWLPTSGVPYLVPAGGQNKVAFPCALSQTVDGSRCAWDKVYSNVNFTGFNAVKVKLNIQNRAAIDHIGYYFELPTLDPQQQPFQAYHGVNALGGSLVEGDQESILALSNLVSPTCVGGSCTLASLSNMTKIRVSPWKRSGTQQDATITIDSFEAINISVALIESDDKNYTTAMKALLDNSKINYFAINKNKFTTAVSSPLNPLAGTKIIIANYATLTAAQADFVANYAALSNAKVIIYGPYSLQGTLSQVLGINNTNGAHIDYVAAMQFTSAAASELVLPNQVPAVYSEVWPKTSSNSSGTAVPIAYWIANGVVTTAPAWVFNNAGAYRDKYLSYTYHTLDEQHVLLAIMLKLRPDMATEIVSGLSASTDKFAAYTSFIAALDDIELKLNAQAASTRKIYGLQKVNEARQAYANAQSSGSTAAFVTIDFLLNARKSLGEAYAQLNQAAESNEIKATWTHTGLGAYPGNWKKSIDYAAAFGFTHVISNFARGANVVYPSAYLCTPQNPLSSSNLCFEKNSYWASAAPNDADPLLTSINEAHAQGLKLFAWKTDFEWGSSTETNLTWWSNSSFAQREYNAVSQTYVDVKAPTPCAAQIRDMDFNVLAEVAQNYAVDGIHLDYIRFNSAKASYDNYCKTTFSEYSATGAQCALSASWPDNSNGVLTTANAACVAEFKAFRKSVITNHVSRIRNMINNVNALGIAGKPYIDLSAAVWESGNDELGQDWPAWAKATPSLLDRAFPMTYSATLQEFQTGVLGSAEKIKTPVGTGTVIPLHFGLGGYRTTNENITSQISWLRSSYPYQARGFSFFEFNQDSIENMLPQVAKAVIFHDEDGDGVHDDVDNCPSLANPTQTDSNNDGVGDSCTHGLTAAYFNNKNLAGSSVMTRIDSTIDFNWSWNSPAPGIINSDYFSVRWIGKVLPPVSGSYTFCTTTDDGVRLWVNGVRIIKKWIDQAETSWCGTAVLTQNQPVAIKMEFYDATEEAVAQLRWEYPGQSSTAVPASQLFVQ